MINQQKRALGLVLLQCCCLSLVARPLLAQSVSPIAATKQSSTLPLEFNNDSAPTGFDGQGRPRSRTSGGSRGGCGDLLVALLPGREAVSNTDAATACNLTSTSTLAATLESNPTLWFHAPAQSQDNVTAELVLLDNNQQVLAIDTITLPAEGGIVALQLSHSLATDQVYHWIFSILNQPNSPSQNPTVEGSLLHVVASSDLSMALATAQDDVARIQALAQYGIWHDALNTLALLYRAEPHNSNLQENWFTLLNSVGLEGIAKAAPNNCCVN